MDLRHHPSRARFLAELRTRAFVPLPAGARLLHFVFHTTPDEAERDRETIVRFAASEGCYLGSLNECYFSLDSHRLRWERHGEFVSYTFVISLEAEAKWPDDLVAPGQLLVVR